MKKLFDFIFDFAILFGFLFECHLIGDSLTTRRIAAIIAFVYLAVHLEEVKALYRRISQKRYRRAIWAFIFCSFLVLINKDIVHEPTNSYFQLWYFANIFLYVIAFSFFCYIRFKSVKYLVSLLTAILIVQAIAVFMAYISTPVRLYLYEMFYDGDDRFEQGIMYGTRIMGVALHSSTGSITCSAIAILFSYATLKKELLFPIYILLFSVLLLMTLFIGRTGVLVEVIIFVFTFFNHPSKSIYKLGIVAPIVVLFIYSLVAIIYNSDTGVSEGYIKWMAGLFNEDRTDTFNAIKSDGLPSLTPEFIFGTGIMTGETSSGVILRSDSGFVRMYTSLGVVGGLVYYWAFYNIFTISKYKRRLPRAIFYYHLLIILLAYVIEYKEPFMMKYIFPWSIMTTGLFMAKNDSNLIVAEKDVHNNKERL